MRSLIKKRKNRLPSFILTLLLWSGTGVIFTTVSPTSFIIIIIFLSLLFLAVVFTLGIILGSLKRGVVVAIIIFSLIACIHKLF